MAAGAAAATAAAGAVAAVVVWWRWWRWALLIHRLALVANENFQSVERLRSGREPSAAGARVGHGWQQGWAGTRRLGSRRNPLVRRISSV